MTSTPHSVPLNHEAIQKAETTIPKGQPVHMVNLVRYRDQAIYQKGETGENDPCTGREAYHKRYVPAFGKVAAGIEGIKILWISSVYDCGLLAGPPGEKWDEVVIVEYPSYEVFLKIIKSEAYERDANPHRKAAVEDARLIATAKVSL